MCDIRRLKIAGNISEELAKHFARKLNNLKEAVEPNLDLEDFSLEQHGPFGLLEQSDKNLSAIGLPENLAHIMSEWVSRLEVAGEIFYILYVMADNDYVTQVYLPDAIMTEAIRLWLSEQPVEEEGADNNESESSHPF